ncbi:pyridoxamine 5'-phosphate oxidase family protein [Haloarculaceae archaeon H-GB2-1]|nr:pyridoxamine 5'-phosphate oxidase family protein [Haloarculaceae archaeon H-GB1-1]MEA5388941.1 pyridoxamine 5'-phosphate oxidase family protein [Haloarculaceae archaeon H-GB11]MEA5406997.1 pyridoxamine 5'-phosphate oxidase family protein [Haloarculaceae archaeon H-GB2-1]
MKDIDFAYTRGLDDEEIDAMLGEMGHGVLSLARDGEAYAVPVVYHYDGDTFFFRLGMAPGSKKRDFVETTETATFVVYEAEGTPDPEELDTWSVVATGPLRELTDAERMSFPTAAEINRDFPPIRVFDEPIDELEIELYAMDHETLTGRTTE